MLDHQQISSILKLSNNSQDSDPFKFPFPSVAIAIHPLCNVFHHLPPLCRRSRHALGALGTARWPQPPAEERVARPPAAQGAHRVETGHFKGHQGVEVRGMQHLGSFWETPKKGCFPGKKIHSPQRIFSTPSSNVAVFLSCICSSGRLEILFGLGDCLSHFEDMQRFTSTCSATQSPEHPLP